MRYCRSIKNKQIGVPVGVSAQFSRRWCAGRSLSRPIIAIITHPPEAGVKSQARKLTWVILGR